MSGTSWFYSNDGKDRTGPVPEQALRDLFRAGAVGAATLVWRDGMASWDRFEAAVPWYQSERAAGSSMALPAPATVTWSGALHPWRRYVSRHVDYFVVGMPFFIGMATPWVSIFGSGGKWLGIVSSQWGASIVLVSIFPLIEAFLLSTWGFTPTRAVMGIYIRNADGSKLSFRQALLRSWLVALRGEALGIPLLMLLTSIAAYDHLDACKATTWDESLNLTVRHCRWGWLRAGGVVAWGVTVFLAFCALRSSL